MIENKKKSCKVTIFGDSYTLVTDESAEHVLKAAQRVDEAMKEIASKLGTADDKKCAVLTALRMTSALLLLEAENDQMKQKEGLLAEAIDRELKAYSSVP